MFRLLLLLLLLFLTAIGFPPGGSSLTLVQTPQYNNTYINGTAKITVHVLAIHPHNTIYLHTYIHTYIHTYNIPTQVQYQADHSKPSTTEVKDESVSTFTVFLHMHSMLL